MRRVVRAALAPPTTVAVPAPASTAWPTSDDGLRAGAESGPGTRDGVDGVRGERTLICA